MMDGGKSRDRSTGGGPRPAGVVAVITPSDGAMAMVPAGFPLRKATFHCRGEHLVARASGHPEIVIPRFFKAGGPTTIASRDGAEVSRYMVRLMLNLSDRVERALSGLATPGTGGRRGPA